jgi:hypothetical protein
MTTPNLQEQKLAQLEKQLERASLQIMELARRVSYLERENSRRKQDVVSLSQRKG